jgi:acetyl esterase/lipase
MRDKRRGFVLRALLALVYMLTLVTLGCGRKTQAQEPTRIQDVVYGHKLGVALTMDVFKPAKPNGIGVIWIVSGGWVSDHKGINPGIAKVFTDRGQTVFEVVHGTQPRFTLPEIVQDIHRAVRFIRVHAAEYGVDPNKLGISGASAGGHLSLMMAAYGGPGDPKAPDAIDRASSKVQAASVFFPPTNFIDYGTEAQRALAKPELSPFWHVFAVPASASDADRDKALRALSPFYGLSKETPPILIFHGDADTLVPIQQSQIVMTKLEELKVPHKLVVREKQKHGWPDIAKDFTALADWYAQYLK